MAAIGPLLKDEHETFCLAYVAGRDAKAAYQAAYPQAKPESCRIAGQRLLKRLDIKQRIHELKEKIADVVTNQVGLNEAMVVNELARVAFSDIRNVCTFGSEIRETIDESEDSGKVVITRTLIPRVVIKQSADLTEDAARAIASVSLSSQGTLNVKMYDKIGALKVLEERFRPKEPGTTNNTTNVAFIDAPPRETYEQWIERRAKMAALDDFRERERRRIRDEERDLGTAGGTANGGDPGDVVR